MNVKGSIVNAKNRLNRVFLSFIPFSSEFSPGNRLIDIYPSCFFLDKHEKGKKAHIQKLDNLTLQALDDSKMVIIVSDVIIKNQVATSIAHIHVYNIPVIKTLHHAVNVIFTKAELFTIRYNINQATQLANINHIIVIIDLLHATKQIFDLLVYLYQIYSVIISRELGKFFIRD